MRAPSYLAAAFIGILGLAAGCGAEEPTPSPDQGVSSAQVAAEVTPGARPPVALQPTDPVSPTRLRGLPVPAADAAP